MDEFNTNYDPFDADDSRGEVQSFSDEGNEVIDLEPTAENTAGASAADEVTTYSFSGADLGENAREIFEDISAKTADESEQASSAYKSAPYSSKAYDTGYNYARSSGMGSVPYNEHIGTKAEKAKKHKGGRTMRYTAALLAAAVLNLAVLGGAFALGHSMGSASNKGSLTQQLNAQADQDVQDSGSDSNGITNTSSTAGSKATTEVAKEVGPAVVGITSTVEGQMSLFGTRTVSEAQGSGIIISKDGYIITNNHVVENAVKVVVQLNTGSEYEARVIGADAQTDLAVIKIDSKEELTVAALGDSNSIEVGETAIAIGNPMGLEFFGSVTQGIISAVNRTITVDDRTMNLIQTDAAINSGNSGGALVNSRGEVIGINTVKVSTTGVEGMGFAIPISEAKPIISDLLEFGYVKGRPVIGVSTRDVTQYMAVQYGWPRGAQVMDVTTSNAAAAGLQQGDIITKVDGNAVTAGSDLTNYKDSKSPGDKVTLEVYKYATGATVNVEVVLSEQKPE